MTDSDQDGASDGLSWTFARSHPVITFLLITFSWSWFFWLAAIPLGKENPALMMVITFVGGYGPALGGVLTLHLQSNASFRMAKSRQAVLIVVFTVLFAVMILRAFAGQIPHYDALPDDPSVTTPVVLLALLACLVGAWIISSARSQVPTVRSRMASLLPSRISWPWLGFALAFLPLLFLLGWGIGTLLGLETIAPPLLDYPTPDAASLLLLTFAMTMLIRGGMEEPGWRGVMLPALQKRYSPLVASLIIAVFWDAWHIPLHLNGFYSSGVIEGMVGRGLVIIQLSILFTWVYNRSSGLLYVLVVFHSVVNLTNDIVPTSYWPAMVLSVAVVVSVVVKDKMYEKAQPASVPEDSDMIQLTEDRS